MKPLHQEMSQRSKEVKYKINIKSKRDADKAKKLGEAVEGVESVGTNLAAELLTVSGTFDSVDFVKKLRKKFGSLTIESIQYLEESDRKKEEPKNGFKIAVMSILVPRRWKKKEEPDSRKEDLKGNRGKEKEKLEEAGPSKEELKKGDMVKLRDVYNAYNPYRNEPERTSTDKGLGKRKQGEVVEVSRRPS